MCHDSIQNIPLLYTMLSQFNPVQSHVIFSTALYLYVIVYDKVLFFIKLH